MEVPLVTALDAHRDELEAGWIHMLNHQLPSLLPVEAFWSELADIFAWMSGEVLPTVLEAMPFGADHEIIRDQVVVSAGEGNQSHIEIIRFASANRLIVELDYIDQAGKRSVRAIEAYSFRRSRAGAVLLMAVREEDGQPRSYNLRQIMGVVPTQRIFTPRYPIELSPTESPNIPRLGRGASVARIARPVRRSAPIRSSGLTYQFRCAVCGKVFSRKTYDAAMNTHKGRNGYDCYGSYGIYVGTKY
jgi:hypothetical protein